jgi:glutathione synthase/RimK-type ligase-like ATP-grasp enzyme
MKTVAIVTEAFDPHADEMVIRLQRAGQEVVRIHPEDFPIMASLGISLTTEETWQGQLLLPAERKINLKDIQSVWWRRPSDFVLPTDLSKDDAVFVKDELTYGLRGLWHSLDCYWVSYPDNIRGAGYKVEQLQRARKIGFEVPRSLVTMNPDEVRDFYDRCNGNIIYKAIWQAMLTKADGQAGQVIYTTPVKPEHLATLDTVKLAPCLFQEYVPKALELRVTVVGNDVFAAEIHSQENEATAVDWRNYSVNVPYRKATLPQEIEQKCLEFVDSYNLNYSALDFILTPDGRYVFLENNPNGQFGFIEDQVPELKIYDALAACLIAGKRV